MKQIALSLMVLLAMSTTLFSQEISDTSFGKGLLNFTAKDSTFSVKFAPRIQVRTNAAWLHDGDKYGEANFDFLVRRARLKFDGFAFSPKLRYKIELGLSNRDISGINQFTRNTPRYILDAVIMWNFYENFELWVGQTKLPGNIERVISSANMELVDRSILNSRFNIDRDVGFQLRHKIQAGEQFLIREKVAVSMGEGRNIATGNLGGLQFTGRLELLPFGNFESKGDYIQADLKREPTPKLMLSGTYDINKDAVKTRSNLGLYMVLENGGFYQTDISTIFVDAMFKYRGFSVMAEYANRDADSPVAVEADGTPTGLIVNVGNSFNVQGGYVFKSNYQVIARYTTISYKAIAARPDQNQYTFGLSKYIVGHKLKVQSDISYTERAGEPSSIVFRMGFDLHF